MARCDQCKFFDWDFFDLSDGDHGEILSCHQKPMVGNLKQFPFKNTKCKLYEEAV